MTNVGTGRMTTGPGEGGLCCLVMRPWIIHPADRWTSDPTIEIVGEIEHSAAELVTSEVDRTRGR